MGCDFEKKGMSFIIHVCIAVIFLRFILIFVTAKWILVVNVRSPPFCILGSDGILSYFTIFHDYFKLNLCLINIAIKYQDVYILNRLPKRLRNLFSVFEYWLHAMDKKIEKIHCAGTFLLLLSITAWLVFLSRWSNLTRATPLQIKKTSKKTDFYVKNVTKCHVICICQSLST